MTGPAGFDVRFDLETLHRLGDGWPVVQDGFLGEERALACAASVRAIATQGYLTPARIGADKTHRPDVRGDRSAWFSELELPPELADLWSAFEALRRVLEVQARIALPRFELQLACYPGEGTRYALHRDTFRGDPSRRITAIYYLNPHWAPEHGGRLRCMAPGGEVRVDPHLDRLVVFLSDTLLHAVEPCWEPRFAATAWYLGPGALPAMPGVARRT